MSYFYIFTKFHSFTRTLLYQEFQSDDWTDSEPEDAEGTLATTLSDPRRASQHVRRLEEKLAASRQELKDYRKLVEGRFDFSKLVEQVNEPQTSADSQPPPRDDDSHYFRSYAENGKFNFSF